MSSEGADTTKCGPCSSRNISKKAESWCPDCEEGLCEQCEEYHKVIKSSRKHETISVESYLKLSPFIQTISQYCEIHGECLELYCPTHQEPCCSDCIAYGHTSCSAITLLSKVVKGVTKSEYFSGVENNIKEMKATIETWKENREVNRERLENQRVHLKKKIKDKHTDLLLSLDKLVSKLNNDLDSKIDIEFDKINDVSDHLDDQLVKLNTEQEHLQSVTKYGTEIQKYLGIRMIDKSIAENVEQLNGYLKFESMQETDISLNIEEQFGLLLTIDKIGSAEVSKSKGDVESISFEPKKAQMTTCIVGYENLKLNHWKSVSVQDQNIGMHITSVCVISDNKIILVNNSDCGKGELYVFSLNGNYQRVVSFEKCPFGIALLNQSEFAVSFSGDQSVHIYDRSDITFKRKLTSGCAYWGLSTKDGKLASGIRGTGIGIMNLTGKMLKMFFVDYKGLAYIHFTGQKLFYTNFDRSVLYCLDSNGEIMWESKFGEMRGPRNICTDKFGNIFVAATDSSKVLLISPDGKLCKTLLNFKQPKAICYDQDRSLLVVASTGGEVSLYTVLYD